MGSNNNIWTLHPKRYTPLRRPRPQRRSRIQHERCTSTSSSFPISILSKLTPGPLPTQVHLRVESQTLHRLPTTRALVFSFKTYLYPISSLKTEYMNTDVSTSTTTSHAHVDSDSETTTDTEKDVGTEGGMERENNRESSALVLAKAIEGLKGGSVPHMWFYKRGVVWGERVLEYLRSWGNGSVEGGLMKGLVLGRRLIGFADMGRMGNWLGLWITYTTSARW